MSQTSTHNARGSDRLEDGINGPNGTRLTRRTLPSPGTKRWVVRRKAEVVSAVRAGLLSLEEACEMYSLSVEEFLSWQRLIEAHGMMGLRATRLQQYRDTKTPAGRTSAHMARD